MKSVSISKGTFFLVATLTLLAVMGAEADVGDFVWAKSMGGTDWDNGGNIVVDDSNNVYTTGSFQGTADFDPGVGVFNLTSAGGYDIFVSKFNSAGDFVWAGSMGGTESDHGSGILVDSAGNVYTTGYFQGTVDFDPGAGTFNLISAGDYDIFVSKLDSAGNFVWAKSMGGTSLDWGHDIAVDSTDNVYTTGHFQGTADFDPGVGTFDLISVGGNDIFVLKLDSAGNFVWAKGMGGTDLEYGSTITVDDASNVYTTGYLKGTVDFDPGPGTFNLTSAGDQDIFVSKLDSAGNFVWAKGMGGTSNERGLGIAVDSAGNVYTTGHFQGTADFDPGAGTFSLDAIHSDIFVSKLDSAGNFVWAKGMGGTDNQGGNDIAVDGAGNVYITGDFYGTADFDPGIGTYDLVSVGGNDIFVLKLDSAGNFVCAKGMGGTNGEQGYGIAVSSAGNVYTVGRFFSTVDFDPGAGTYNLTSAGSYDIFVSKDGPDTSPPNATAITPASPGPTNADSIDFTVVFDEPVRNFGEFSDVILMHNGTASSDISISGSNAIYTVTITGITGDGSFTLAINTASDIQDIAAGNPLATSVTSVPVVIDNTPPGITIGPPSQTIVTQGDYVEFTVDYTGETSSWLTETDITLDVTGDVTATVTVVSAKSDRYIVTLSDIAGSGTLGFTIAAATAIDAAGNFATAASAPVLVTAEPEVPVHVVPLVILLLGAGVAALRMRRRN